mmetsp:Transcript_81336/g.204647  ORF Transcript_81336/g.204647 Transcript_81336/m.204647 type:complete len:234 (-) Transcript_81336:248-949(-)
MPQPHQRSIPSVHNFHQLALPWTVFVAAVPMLFKVDIKCAATAKAGATIELRRKAAVTKINVNIETTLSPEHPQTTWLFSYFVRFLAQNVPVPFCCHGRWKRLLMPDAAVVCRFSKDVVLLQEYDISHLGGFDRCNVLVSRGNCNLRHGTCSDDLSEKPWPSGGPSINVFLLLHEVIEQGLPQPPLRQPRPQKPTESVGQHHIPSFFVFVLHPVLGMESHTCQLSWDVSLAGA